MKTNKLKALFALAAVATLATVINCGGGSSPPQTGFRAKGEQYVATFNGYAFYGGTSIQGSWYFDNGPTTGTTTFFQAFTSSGYYHVANGRVPARWGIAVPTGCIQYLDPFFRDVTVGSNQVSRCVIAFAASLTADPSSIDLANPPPTVTFGGEGFDATYGMPVIEYYDQYSGELIASTTAISVAGDGSTAVAYTPSLNGVYTDSYNVIVSNKASDGSNSIFGVATFSACCIDPPPPEPPPDPPACGENQVCEVQQGY